MATEDRVMVLAANLTSAVVAAARWRDRERASGGVAVHGLDVVVAVEKLSLDVDVPSKDLLAAAVVLDAALAHARLCSELSIAERVFRDALERSYGSGDEIDRCSIVMNGIAERTQSALAVLCDAAKLYAKIRDGLQVEAKP